MTFHPFIALLLCLATIDAARLRAADPVPPRRLEGEIEGARWAALVPENWAGRLLIEAPDRVSAPAPLAAELDAATPDHQVLLAAGWALATTSYRRTGPILIDAIDDLRALRDHLVVALGPPKIVLVEGVGMGGLITVLMAERHSDEFHGFLARDPKLEMRDPRALRLKCDHQPRGPLLFLFGEELAPAAIDYRTHARAVANAESIVPVLWFQAPPGEGDPAAAPATVPAAVDALAAWVQTRKAPESRLEDLPAAEDPPPPVEAPKETVVPAEPVPLPDEPPPTVPVDDTPAR